MKFFWSISSSAARLSILTYWCADIIMMPSLSQSEAELGREWPMRGRGKSDGASISVSVNLYIRMFVRWMESPIGTSSAWALSPMTWSLWHQHYKHTDQKDTEGIPSLKAYLNIDWKQFDNQNHRVPILNIGVTKVNVKIVKVSSIRQLFIQRSENYWVVGPLLFNDWII